MDDDTLTHPEAGGGRLAMPVSPETQADLSGLELGGCTLIRRMAAGGMGVVYEAVQKNLDRRVAVKVIHEQLAFRPEFLQRFEREAKAAAALNHPHIVQVHDFGNANGRQFLVMEFVDGCDLSAHVARHGPLPIATALDFVEQAARGLRAACEKAIIHRDIKPSNLLLSRDGQVKISDLGLAKILEDPTDMTLTSVAMGSPHFLAPEQAEDSRNADHRSDIYSLGLTLLFLLTGRKPYEGKSAFSLILAHATKPLPFGQELGKELPAEVESLIRKMSAKKPEQRPASYQELLEDLARVKAGVAPTPASMAPSMGRKVVSAVSTGLILAIAVAGWFWTSHANRRNLKEALEESAPKSAVPDSQNHPAAGPDRGEPERGPGRIPLPMPTLPRLAFAPLAEAPVAEMLAEADRFAKEHPTEFINIINRYRQVESRGAGTPAGGKAADQLDYWKGRHQEEIGKAIDQFEARMRDKLKAGDVSGAYLVWKDFPSNLRMREVDNRIAEILSRSLPADFHPPPPPAAPQPDPR